MIIVSHEELKRLEAYHGAAVWQMGSWNSDGVFGYTVVQTEAVEKAVETVCSSSVAEALARVQPGQQTALFLELLRAYPKLVEKIAAAYREESCAIPKPGGGFQ